MRIIPLCVWFLGDITVAEWAKHAKQIVGFIASPLINDNFEVPNLLFFGKFCFQFIETLEAMY